MSRLHRTALAVALALLTSACGPERPFELGVKEVPSDLILGRQTKPLPQSGVAQLPPITFFTDTAGPTGPPPSAPPPPLPEVPLPPLPCPASDPLAPARLPATLEVLKPPVPATYAYRTSGVIVSSRSRNLPTSATHEVRNVVPLAPGEFTYDVAVSIKDERTTTTTYHVVPRGGVVPAGLYIQRIDSDASIVAFQPKPELLVLPFPAVPGTFTAAGSDGATTVTYEGVIEPVERVDACGTNIDGIKVRLVNGRSTTGRPQDGTFLAEEFEASYVFATQYGGLAIKHFLKASMPGSTDLNAREVQGTISREPVEPK